MLGPSSWKRSALETIRFEIDLAITVLCRDLYQSCGSNWEGLLIGKVASVMAVLSWFDNGI